MAGIGLALVAGVGIADEPSADVPRTMLTAPEGSCVTGVDMTNLHGQKDFDVAAETPVAVVAEMSGVASSDAVLEVQSLVDDTKVIYVEEHGARTAAVRVANFGGESAPLWVPISVESITECGIDGEPPSANELVS